MSSTEVRPVEEAGESGGTEPFEIIVFHHTHWDREWWATYQDFRIQLVELIDTLLDTVDTQDDFRSFLLDGQTVVLTDYLDVRPDARCRLTDAIRAGRIECGPWYVLPDEFLVSGESHIRNLLLSRRIAARLEIPLQHVGYLPDTFGHIAQMPQILRGFGIGNAFVWRGYGGGTPATQEFLWEAPDGSRVFTHWFPQGYYQMPFLHFDNAARPYEDRMGRIFAAIERLGPGAVTNVLLMPYGGDHRTIDAALARKIEEANRAIAGRGAIRWGTLSEYVAAVQGHHASLGTVRGDLRALGADRPHIFAGVLSTRLYLKRLNFEGQTWLERYAEPLAALAWNAGHAYDADMLWKAWEYLLQNHPHDSICGCSIDQVHREMVPRFEQSRQIAEIVSAKSAERLNGAIDASDLADDEVLLVAHNTLAWGRTGLASVWLPRAAISRRTHRLLDREGREVPFQARPVDGVKPRSDRAEWTEVTYLARGVPGLGYQAYRLTARHEASAITPSDAALTGWAGEAALGEAVSGLKVGPGLIENGVLRVVVDAHEGTLTITDRRTGQVYGGLNRFEDGGDAGDSYNYSPPLCDQVLRSGAESRVHVSLAEVGAARATLRVDLEWELPASLTPDRGSRSAETVRTRMTSFVSLAAESSWVEIVTEWENRSRDHRLRVLFPLGEKVDETQAQGHFSVGRHRRVAGRAQAGWPEVASPTMPQQGWVSVHRAARGLTIANRGLPEYELQPDESGTLALTILRAEGWLSRDDLLTRQGGAGAHIPTPDAQALGLNRAAYAVVPHAGDWLSSGAYRTAEEYLAPLYGSFVTAAHGAEPWSRGLISLEGDHTLVLSAVKKAENSEYLVLRFWNVGERETEARLAVHRPLAEARLLDLKEDPVSSELQIEEEGIVLRAGPAQIVTLGLRFQGRERE